MALPQFCVATAGRWIEVSFSNSNNLIWYTVGISFAIVQVIYFVITHANAAVCAYAIRVVCSRA